MTKVTLRPEIHFSIETPVTLEKLEKMHHQSHEQCFIANSVTTKLVTDVFLVE